MDPNTGLGSTDAMVKGMFGVGGIPALADAGRGTQCNDEADTIPTSKDGNMDY